MIHSEGQIRQIQNTISRITGINTSDICSTSRKAEIVQARHLSMYFCRFNTRANTLTIANLHGKNNHATVLHACNSIHREIKRNQKLRAIFDSISRQLENA